MQRHTAPDKKKYGSCKSNGVDPYTVRPSRWVKYNQIILHWVSRK